MHVCIAGGTGFIGDILTQKLLDKGYRVTILTRSDRTSQQERLHYAKWLSPGTLPEKSLQDVDAIVNLAGESLNAGRWTTAQKEQIIDSRLQATQALTAIASKLPHRPSVYIQASAVGIYGTDEDNIFTEETTTTGSDFLANTVKAWEAAAQPLENVGIRVCKMRFGVVLGKDHGALPKISLPYKLGFGGTVGSGRQWVSWVHVDDVVGALLHCLEADVEGVFNTTAPHPERMQDFGKTVASVLNRPHWLPAPAFALRAVLGEMSLLVLEGQRVLPDRLQQTGYTFKFPELKGALQDIYQS
ncbi:TIGR01777 family oxidoreductase [Bacillus fonticola]|uniref:TIGR01777 family oxidoreductase n=1 Tax=Bacillus fonticola TaxID=2728853 RepID=UPI0014755625|nr:TIGR01777 family oxidoreductase [Bacillus fonticola]